MSVFAVKQMATHTIMIVHIEHALEIIRTLSILGILEVLPQKTTFLLPNIIQFTVTFATLQFNSQNEIIQIPDSGTYEFKKSCFSLY